MSSLREAYQSLDKAKLDEANLMKRRDDLRNIYSILRESLRGHRLYLNIDEDIDILEADNNDYWKKILATLLIYILVFGIIDFIVIMATGSMQILPSSIAAGFGSYGVHFARYFPDIIKNNKKIKKLKLVKSVLGDDPKYKNKSLEEIIELVNEELEIVQNDLYAMDGTIMEYEKALKEANNEVAKDVLDRSGIPADVKINSNMKVLAKRYEHQ